jgi:hypothetical protein
MGAMGQSPMSRASRLETSMTKTEVGADSKAFVTLRFAGDDLDPDEISAVLPVKPTRAHCKGEEFFAGPRAGNLHGRTGMWFIATRQTRTRRQPAGPSGYRTEPAVSDAGRYQPDRQSAHSLRRPRHLLLASPANPPRKFPAGSSPP